MLKDAPILRLDERRAPSIRRRKAEDDAIAVEQPAAAEAIAEEVEREASQRPDEPSRLSHELPTGSDPVSR